MAQILTAGDNDRNLHVLESILKGYGHGVTCARNGAEALKFSRQSRPDLIITDMFKPVMDGFALCLEWKADEGLKESPLIFYTAACFATWKLRINWRSGDIRMGRFSMAACKAGRPAVIQSPKRFPDDRAAY